ncbi:MAG: hypothetical protein WC308_00360 [archaeon]|jgi:hypothetical protein
MVFMFDGGRGQSSLEFLLLLLGFFSALAILLPAISFSMDAFFEANDTALAKQIAERVQSTAGDFDFFGNGSKTVFEFVPARSIIVSSDGRSIFFATSSKRFEVIFAVPQNFQLKEFKEKFFVELGKENGAVVFKSYSN